MRKINARPASLPLVCAALAAFVFNGHCASPLYPAVVKGDGALGYYRFNDSLTRTLVNVNSGSLGIGGNATNDLVTFTGGKVHSMPGAIVGDGNRAAFYDFTTRTEIPFNAALNTPNTQPFSVEAWLYAVNDQATTGAGGMGVLCNRLKPSDTSFRQGWVVFQRGLDADHSPGQGMGWDFQMYNNLDGSTHLQVKSGVPITLGKWQHYVVVYDPVQVSNATLTVFIDGVQVNQSTWTGAPDGVTQGYFACAGNSSPAASPHGQPAMSLGGYNNSNPDEPFGFANPWTGGIDEFAWYSNKLSPAQVLAHYQNGTNAARSTPYDKLVKSDNPVAYLRLDELAPGPDIAANVGDQRSAGNATNAAAVKHPGPSALAGRTEDGSFTGRRQGLSATGEVFADVPWTQKNNPDASTPFTLEGWFRPRGDQMSPGPCPINNRLAQGIGQASGVNRTGWIMYQRGPNATYSSGSGESAVGWALRMYHGNGTGGDDVVTGASSGVNTPDAFGYKLGEWQHVVFTWEPQQDNGPTPSGSEQYQGVLKAYTNGVLAATTATNVTPTRYAANVNPTEDGRPPADLAIGMYNIASQGSGLEEFDGDIDEVAFYNNYVLTPDQVLSHYQTGTNAHPATNYETLVFNAAGDYYLANVGTPIPERTTVPQTYLRFNQPAYFPAANSGSLGYLADGSLLLTTNNGNGPVTAGFENPNPALPVTSSNTWASFNNPSGLNIAGQITLEAWIKPDATQPNDPGRIISHGPPTLSHYLGMGYDNSVTNSTEVFLRVDGGSTYVLGSATNQDTVGTMFSKVTFIAPGGDFGGGNWIYLAGTYDGANWKLYRNGVLAATAAGAFGALQVNGGDWAVGSTGDGWADAFSGQIDEVAIYGTALSPATIAAHYYVGLNGPVSLTIAPAAGNTVNVTWPAGTLQQASAVTGPYTDVLVTGNPATSPYNTAAAGAKFYRVKL